MGSRIKSFHRKFNFPQPSAGERKEKQKYKKGKTFFVSEFVKVDTSLSLTALTPKVGIWDIIFIQHHLLHRRP